MEFAVENKKIYILSIIIGLFFGLMFLLMPIKLYFVIVLGMGALVLILWRTEVGIIFIVTCSPFLPTMALVGLILITLLSFLVNMFVFKKYAIKLNILDFFLMLFGIVVIYGSIISYDPLSSFKITLVYISYILFYFILVNTVKSKKMLYILIVIFIAVSFFVSMYGIYQNFAGVYSTQSWVDEEMFEDIKTRVYSTFDNPNVLGEYLVITIPIAFALFWITKRPLYKLIFGLIAVSLLPCLIFTWARGSWLGVALAIAIFALFKDKKLVFLGVIALAILPFILPESILFRLESIGNTTDTSTAYRVSIWLGSLKVIKNYWLTGIGLGSGAFSKIYPIYALSGASYALHAHNLYLQIFVEMGIAGIVSFLLMIFMFYKNILSTFSKTKDILIKTFLIACMASISGYLAQGLVDNIWYNYRVVLIFYIVLGLSSIAGKIVLKESE
jgi:O-antigen ligase